MTDIHQILQEYWGHSAFRPLQEDIIRSVLNGTDSLALLPTGGGKSICFQVPAMAKEGICIVVSPLIALMKDQVENLEKKGIPAAAIYSGMTVKAIELTLNAAVFGRLKFLYISPERLETKIFIEHLKQMNVNLLAIDEAHCISQWGYDFRPPYLKIAEIRRYLPKVPVMALTATATPEVVVDIQEKLEFKNGAVFQKSFMRENLTYYVFHEENKLDRLMRIIQTVKGSGVVYVRNRRKTAEIAEFLCKHQLKATFYHAGLDQQIRNQRQADWISGKIPIIVATNAFGMGIDKPNVRFVVHLDLPDSLEAYFQEAGRGGRDGLRAHAVLLNEKIDLLQLEKSFRIAFPLLETIKSTYRALGNYYQIPVGSGKDASFDFDLKDFSSQYKFHPQETYHALKFLEREGLLLLTEEINAPSRLMIITDKNTLYDFQVKYEEYDPLIKTILRSYGGVFSNLVKIDEKEIAARLDSKPLQVIKWLNNLAKASLIEYAPQKDKPQIIFSSERIDDKNLRISKSNYEDRKKAAEKRLKAVANYAESTNNCRSQLLLRYFGEKNSKECGRCDVCIENNKRRLDQALFDEISKEIKSIIAEEPTEINALVKRMTKYSYEKIVQVARFLLENKEIAKNEREEFTIR